MPIDIHESHGLTAYTRSLGSQIKGRRKTDIQGHTDARDYVLTEARPASQRRLYLP